MSRPAVRSAAARTAVPGVPPISRRYQQGARGGRPASAEQVKAASNDSALPAANPWDTDCPKQLRSIRTALLRGNRGSDRMVARLERYNQGHPGDARGHLLLARILQNRGAMVDAVAAYRAAFKRDPSSRGDPSMLRDLRYLASLETTEHPAGQLLLQAYGPETRAAVDKSHALEDPGDTVERVRQALTLDVDEQQ